ncbi:MAG: PadR family transcriptional regulator [Symploca sp. SIO2G7]|nr:PadR family transcriptional regulator [Symploca sp. SIO2G7]
MRLNDVYQFFQDSCPTAINKELAVCYVLSVLTQKESYGTELMQIIKREYPTYRLSETILYRAFAFLERIGAVSCRKQRTSGKGRPRHIYKLLPEWREQAEELSELWHAYVRGDYRGEQAPRFEYSH